MLSHTTRPPRLLRQRETLAGEEIAPIVYSKLKVEITVVSKLNLRSVVTHHLSTVNKTSTTL